MRRLRLAGFVVLVGTLVGAATAAGSAQSPAGTMRGAADRKTVKYPEPKKSDTVLKADHRYKIVARDTVGYWPVGSSEYPDAREGEGADALYCYVTWRCPKPELWRQLRINGLALDEFAGKTGKIPYNASHLYTVTVSGVTGKLTYTSAGGQSGGFTVEVIDLGKRGAGAAATKCRRLSGVTRTPSAITKRLGDPFMDFIPSRLVRPVRGNVELGFDTQTNEGPGPECEHTATYSFSAKDKRDGIVITGHGKLFGTSVKNLPAVEIASDDNENVIRVRQGTRSYVLDVKGGRYVNQDGRRGVVLETEVFRSNDANVKRGETIQVAVYREKDGMFVATEAGLVR